jgi:hypothetical protein
VASFRRKAYFEPFNTITYFIAPIGAGQLELATERCGPRRVPGPAELVRRVFGTHA